MQRKGFSIWQIIGGFVFTSLLVAILFPVFARAPGTNRANCLSSMKQVANALAQYQQDYAGHYPLIAFSSLPNTSSSSSFPDQLGQFGNYGWADAIYPYLKNMYTYQCPEQLPMYDRSKPPAPAMKGFTDYWLNTNLNGLSVESLDAANIISNGDGNDGSDITDARYNLPALPTSWLNDKYSPPYRHRGMGTYIFVDGHAKMLTPDKITNRAPSGKQPTFAVK